MNEKLLTNPLGCDKIIISQINEENNMPKRDQLSRIRIEGYRSIKQCDIKLGDINILIGGNGAGKSNFISALSLLQDIINKELKLSVAKKGVSSLFYNGIKTTDKIAMEVYFGENSYGFDLAPTEANSVLFLDEYFGYYSPQGMGTHSIVEKGHTESVWDKGVKNLINYYVQPVLDKQNWRVYHFHDTTNTAKVKQECNVSNNLCLQNDAGNLASFLLRLRKNYPKRYNDIVETIQLIAPFFDDFVLIPNEENKELIVLKWKQKGCDDVFNASQFSDGTLRFICLMTLLLQPAELQPASIIIDEPELGLHPSAIVLLSSIIQQVSHQKQIIISTQSVDLINEFSPDDIIVVENSDNGSVFKKLDSQQLESWLDMYSLGELWLKNVIGGRP